MGVCLAADLAPVLDGVVVDQNLREHVGAMLMLVPDGIVFTMLRSTACDGYSIYKLFLSPPIDLVVVEYKRIIWQLEGSPLCRVLTKNSAIVPQMLKWVPSPPLLTNSFLSSPKPSASVRKHKCTQRSKKEGSKKQKR